MSNRSEQRDALFCEACGGDLSDENPAQVGVSTPLAKALGIDEPEMSGPLPVCDDCYNSGLEYIDSGDFRESGYNPMPEYR